MKGISHFAIGIAAASCFPAAVHAAADGSPLYFILAGVCGLLPDTLDFKFVRFLYRADILVTPDPLRPDPRLVANAVAVAFNRAAVTQRAVNLKLNTILLGADRWQRYTVSFDVPARQVRVTYGPIVDTGGNVLEAAPEEAPSASAPLETDVELDYFATSAVDIFDGPVYRLEPTATGRVRPVFIPWHRSWTHSLVVAALLGLAGTALWDAVAGLVVFAAYAAHILADQLGFLGSNLFAPFTRRRSAGLKLMHAVSPLPNFLAVWLSVLLVMWNLAAATTGGIAGWNPLRYLLLAGVLPAGLFWFLQRRAESIPPPAPPGG